MNFTRHVSFSNTFTRQRLDTLFIDGGGIEDGIRSVYKSNAFRINLFKDLKAHICKITHNSDKIVNLHNSLIVTGLVVSIAKISPNCRNLSAEADLNAHNWFLSCDTKYQIFCLSLLNRESLMRKSDFNDLQTLDKPKKRRINNSTIELC